MSPDLLKSRIIPRFVVNVNAVFDIFREEKIRIVAPLELRGKREEAPTLSNFHINAKMVVSCFQLRLDHTGNLDFKVESQLAHGSLDAATPEICILNITFNVYYTLCAVYCIVSNMELMVA
ncbi:hypothetical protein HZH68_010544 [Vespula germanica]|uniref:Uncharacterized protein n=1 Tax=Vespula germanica TaxID=30212 RepID=A0A834N2T0_VESGE|nr:hypothetical protein HZH68_010544 [Vespula germanica]